MKKLFILKLCFLVLVSFCLTSCFTMKNVPEKVDYSGYVGYSEQMIKRDFGAPTIELSDLLDGKILVYEKSNISRGSQSPQKTQFFINKSSLVYRCLSNETKDVYVKKFSVGKLLGLVIPLTIAIPTAIILLSEEAYYYY